MEERSDAIVNKLEVLDQRLASKVIVRYFLLVLMQCCVTLLKHQSSFPPP